MDSGITEERKGRAKKKDKREKEEPVHQDRRDGHEPSMLTPLAERSALQGGEETSSSSSTTTSRREGDASIAEEGREAAQACQGRDKAGWWFRGGEAVCACCGVLAAWSVTYVQTRNRREAEKSTESAALASPVRHPTPPKPKWQGRGEGPPPG